MSHAVSRSSEPAARAARSQRINLRASESQEEVLRRAASVTDSSLTEFVLGSAVEKAERILADRRRFAISDLQWQEFDRLLEAPLAESDRLRRLAGRPSPFADHGGE